MEEALIALAGAIVGGAASLAGSVWVARRELTRVARVRMYNELLPPMIQAWAASGAGLFSQGVSREEFDALRRQAVLAGSRDERAIRRLAARFDERAALLSSPVTESDDEGNASVIGNAVAEVDAAARRLHEAAVEFSEFLAKRIR